ncbi:endopeptidase La [Truepera radiovictrix]|uniref:Lon protease n=1 Tax=Truepera radiovictrix (strain DSM 17093 / CIP 108686 / LMG 22925 / RQ-24) TaxID=649638 RepID=D7CXX3_TRURR|nr:endopeptidase La [Truepera radiovictrix]ADI13333.1 ATP-dependent protease La [Truepera radiovictrix DSM 17093]WMT58102.1 endopeptidase La [Truepera radiovictrix]
MEWELPVIALRTVVVLPRTLENVDVGRPKSKRALEEAQAADNRVLLLAQREPRIDDPSGDDLYTTGTLGVIKQVIRLPDDTLQVLVEGKERAEVIGYLPGMTLRARVRTLSETNTSGETRTRALVEQVKSAFGDYAQQNKNLRLDSFHLENLRSLKDPGALADVVTKYSTWEVADKQAVLEESDAGKRLELVYGFLSRDLERFDTEKQISARVKQQMDANQREYYLREQMKAIQKELGGGEDTLSEVEELRRRVSEKNMPKEAEKRALKEIERLEKMPGGSPEATVVRTYLDTILDLPWSEVDEEHLDIAHSERILNEDHYALEEPKERILEFLAVRQLTKDRQDSDYRAPILCFVGPPGVGKTSLGKSIARSLNRAFVRMSLGGVRDEAEIRGHRRTYIGSLPGRIIQGMKTAGKLNPVFLLDEIDKMTSDFRGDPSSALLEVLDPEQNNTFADHYLEIPYDLSKVMFITTANSLATIPRPLLDRMEVIQIPGYTLDEKLEIARRYRVPRQLRAHGLEGKLALTESALRRTITEYTREAGVRNLDRTLAKLARKSAKEFLSSPWEGERVLDERAVRKLLGVPPFRDERAEREPQVGLAHGLAYTAVGGVTLDIEAVSTPGKGKVTLTGQLGDVMKESAQAGIAYLRTRTHDFNLPADFHEKRDLHVHVLEGATPKDGPSAGIAMATAVVSALTGRPARGDIAMTGEITLRGRVLPIGGVKEKLLAAHQAGIAHVIIPEANEANLEDVPEAILNDLKVTTVRDFNEVIKIMLLDESQPDFVPPKGDEAGVSSAAQVQ